MRTIQKQIYGTPCLADEVEKMMGGLFSADRYNAAAYRPPVDAVEDDEGYRLTVELPGYTKDQIEIKIENNLLTLASQSEGTGPAEEEESRFLLRERARQGFRRSFVLPRDADREGVEARFENGLLILLLKKVAEAKPRTINIQ